MTKPTPAERKRRRLLVKARRLVRYGVWLEQMAKAARAGKMPKGLWARTPIEIIEGEAVAVRRNAVRCRRHARRLSAKQRGANRREQPNRRAS
jgi:hypothetical protein